ncbi:probable mediator of RNA polymerase II transcription subunit 26a [Brassica rapa]|uniref:TFIIS N-terminal domain-containing protein n=1 Tax=Brassica campestris TaxID=3711 RepID=M4EM50_BRACM|nr:probable mediator of RNA polymerase II transcription subunit 26a [Brassica rapa]
MKPSEHSLDNWRDYFRRGDSDIFGIINHAIILAAADFPKEFKSRRDGIAQLLFSCNASRSCIGCGHEDNNHETVGVSDDSGGGGGDEEDEKKLNDDEIVVVEVMRIRDILLNKDDESNSVLLLRSLRKLESMSLSVDLLKDTEIGKAVNGLRRHGSDEIRELAKALFAEWKELVDQWMNSVIEVAGDEGTPESANYSVVDEAEAFPSPPHDLDFLAPEPTGFELSQILDGLDCDGNPRHSVEPKRKTMRRPEGTHEANLVGRYNKNQQTRREEIDARPMKHSATVEDEHRRQPKQTREQMVHPIQRKPIVIPEQKRNSQQDKLKALDLDARFEFAKRKLQESYQQHDKAKRQRTIQVLETIPKQGKAHKPQLKRPVRR